MHNIRTAFRSLSRTPGFTVLAIVILALGIGATTAVFSVVNALLLKPLAYQDSAQLVQVQSRHPEQGTSVLAPAAFQEIAANSHAFAVLAAQQYYYVNLTRVPTPSRLTEAQVTGDYFRLLGVAPLLGRTWNPSEAAAGAAPVVVLGASVWRSQFNADPGIVGRQVVLDDVAHTVLGVMPDGFSDPWGNAVLWRPIPVNAAVLSDHTTRYWSTFARLRPGISLAEADRDLAVIADHLRQSFASDYRGWTLGAADLRGLIIGDYRTGLLVVLGAVLCVLAITCANVAGLSTVRALARHKELAIRAAIGASRRQLGQQLLTESLLLALVGGGLGVLLANWGVSAILHVVGNGWLPRAGEIAVNGPVLALALATTLLTGLAFGLAPAWNAARADAGDALRATSSRGTAGRGFRRLRHGLVITELALALVLLIGAGLLCLSFRAILRQEPGMRTENLLALGVSLPISHYHSPETMRAFYERATAAVAALPGVEAAGFTQTMPFTWGNTAALVPVGASQVNEQRPPPAFYDSVSVDYFRAAGIPLLGGRLFTPRDNSDSPGVVLINAAAARAFFGAENPIGRRLRNANANSSAEFEIVGVVGNVLRRGPADNETPLQVYRPLLQRPPAFATLVVHTRTSPDALTRAVQQAIWSADPDQAVEPVDAVATLIRNTTSQSRLYLALFGLFGGLAVTLSAIGLYGLVAFTVTQRTREFGIRSALGASPREVLTLVLRENSVLILAGLGLGLVGAAAAARLLQQMVFRVSVYDPLVFTLVPLLLTVIALAACWLPARRATRVDPSIALRAE